MRAFIPQVHKYCAALVVASIATLAPQSARAVVLYSNNFDTAPTVAAGVSATLTPGLSLTSIPLNPWWTGDYYANQTFASSILSLSGAVPSGPVDIDFTLGFLGSWDSSDGEPLPDYLKISINGSPVLTELTTNNASGTVQNYGGGTVVGKPVIATSNYLHASDTIVDMSTASSLSFIHPGGPLTLEILGYGGGYTPTVTWGSNPTIYDEGWGIDNLVITSANNQSVPAPLPLLGAASAYRFSRRLKGRIRRGNQQKIAKIDSQASV
jgi:hypothetical protein